ncbi:MAG TPA: hypothetical protein VL307_17540 [Chitinophagaceae bacterium]|nr:hypothetical protein [Chitinophagaceae bacterium]
MYKPAFIVLLLFCCSSVLHAQDTLPEAKHASIIFPYPMYTERWRSSLGITLLTTPEDITEEVRVRVPAIDFRVLRRISNQFMLEGRINAQILQNQFLAGFRWVKPLSGKFYVSAGANTGYWFGFLTTAGFNSRGSGWLAYPQVSLGYRTKRNLLLTLSGQSSVNLGYQAYNGDQKSSEGRAFYNGETITIALEQPFYHHHHLALAFSAINNYFYWQTWSLFYRVNRKVFYPQITVAFIL